MKTDVLKKNIENLSSVSLPWPPEVISFAAQLATNIERKLLVP